MRKEKKLSLNWETEEGEEVGKRTCWTGKSVTKLEIGFWGWKRENGGLGFWSENAGKGKAQVQLPEHVQWVSDGHLLLSSRLFISLWFWNLPRNEEKTLSFGYVVEDCVLCRILVFEKGWEKDTQKHHSRRFIFISQLWRSFYYYFKLLFWFLLLFKLSNI